MTEALDVVIVGGGPAGLRAAEVAALAGRSVTVFDGKPSVGRKFLVAGKGGLNLTHGENFETFVSRYAGGEIWQSLLADFKPQELREWCHGLGQETFQATSGRVYPKALKGAPVLRAWLEKLKGLGVEIRPRHLWKDLREGNLLVFENGVEVRAKAIVFALGGGSWPKTGSDGSWLEKFQEMGVKSETLVSSNCGWEVDWPESLLEKSEGMPMKNIVVSAGGKQVAGELLITRYGLEGGTVYALGRELRAMKEPVLEIDFKPTFSHQELLEKLGDGGGSLLELATRRWKLSEAARQVIAIEPSATTAELLARTKACRISLRGPRPIAEAISSAGGVCWSELDEKLMLKLLPGVFLCGEMVDWDAPTGGYLLQGAFATGTRAGKSAAVFAG
ncbi:MAG: TIGR03862 family flavoprotein [Verrucomicrobiota bacterium]